jgi:hypothetical protein
MVLRLTVPAVGEIVIAVTDAEPLLLPPQAEKPRMSATATNETARIEIFALMVSSLMLTFIISFLSAL